MREEWAQVKRRSRNGVGTNLLSLGHEVGGALQLLYSSISESIAQQLGVIIILGSKTDSGIPDSVTLLS